MQIMRSELQENLNEFLVRNASPDRVRRDDEAGESPLDLLRALGELGYLSIGLPEEHGGDGGMVEMVEVMEEIGRHYLGLGHLVGRVMYAQQILLHHGTEAQKAKWLPALAAGEAVFSILLTEPDSGSDLASLRTTATQVDGGYRVNGQKVFTSSFGYSNVSILLARTDPSEPRHRGLTAFLIDPTSPGIESRDMTMLGGWTEHQYEVFFNDVDIPADSILGELAGGWAVAMGHLARERLFMAGRAIGATSDVLMQTAGYVAARQQFGHPISDFQTVRHQLADIRIALTMARAGLYEVARRVGDGDVSRDAAMVKVFAGELYFRASSTAVVLYGGAGYTRDFAVQRHLRDSPVYVIGGGSAAVLRDVISRDMF